MPANIPYAPEHGIRGDNLQGADQGADANIRSGQINDPLTEFFNNLGKDPFSIGQDEGLQKLTESGFQSKIAETKKLLADYDAKKLEAKRRNNPYQEAIANRARVGQLGALDTFYNMDPTEVAQAQGAQQQGMLSNQVGTATAAAAGQAGGGLAQSVALAASARGGGQVAAETGNQALQAQTQAFARSGAANAGLRGQEQGIYQDFQGAQLNNDKTAQSLASFYDDLKSGVVKTNRQMGRNTERLYEGLRKGEVSKVIADRKKAIDTAATLAGYAAKAGGI